MVPSHDLFRHEELLPREASGRVFTVELAVDCPYFEGHFPGHPVLPAVAQLDIVLRLIRTAGWPGAEAAALDGLRFRRQVSPGTRFEVHFDELRPERPVPFRLVQNGKPVSEGTVTFHTSESPA